MSLSPGTRLGTYEITGLIGVGGMGEVYHARDAKLGRDVALKTLPTEFIHDGERIARFQREAQVLAALNHPNIAAIYGLEETDGNSALVLEFVDGPTIADRIARGAIPLDEALPIARQVAGALEAAHGQAIIHRDLKPANIKLRPDGTVKVLDFGLAKALEPSVGSSSTATLANSPTLTSPVMMTGVGVILGTAAYMSPEQAKGRLADKRSDIWAFGCVLYEMLTGRQAYQGEDVSEILAEVIKGTPDWSQLPQLPAPVQLLIRRCLEKDRQKRISDFSTVGFLLTECEALSPAVEPARPRRNMFLTFPAIAAAIVLAVAAVTAGWRSASSPAVDREVIRLGMTLPTGQRFTNTGRQLLSISPDGRQLAYSANGQLWVRSMSARDARPLTEGNTSVVSPTFSPDGKSIAFWAAGSIRRVPVTGGSPIVVTSAPQTIYGLNWADDGIYYADLATSALDGPTRIRRVAPSGGEALTLAESSAGTLFFGPRPLPDRRGVLVTVAQGIAANRWDRAKLVIVLPSGEQRVVVEPGSDGRYLPTGQLVYSLGGVVFGAPFDLTTLRTTGAAATVLEGVSRGYPASGAAQYDVSTSGTLALIPGPATLPENGRSLASFSIEGSETTVSAALDQYEFPRASPDGKRLAVGANDGATASIWIVSLDGGADRRRLATPGRNRFPIWSPDGQRVAFQSDRQGDRGIFWQAADGSGNAQRLTTAAQDVEHVPAAWTKDGAALIFEVVKGGRYTLSKLDLKRGEASALFDTTSEAAFTPALSPDGKWLAYHTRETGATTGGTLRDTVWLRPFPITSDVYEVSSEGTSHHPLWLAGGRELLYVIGAGQVVSRPIAISSGVNMGKVRVLPFGVPTGPPAAEARTFDLLPDGRIVSDANPRLNGPNGVTSLPGIEVVVNWFEELKRQP